MGCSERESNRENAGGVLFNDIEGDPHRGCGGAIQPPHQHARPLLPSKTLAPLLKRDER